MNLFDSGGATWSPCNRYRYKLWREWSGGTGEVNFLMLNPSTADATANDPTVERCEQRAREWGFNRLVVTNLFAYRATSPLDMKAQADPVGPENDAAIVKATREAQQVICAWGEHGEHLGRSAAVLTLLAGVEMWALRINMGGNPAHPLYLPYSLRPVRWER